jgi:uncharacterized protein (TIGR03435 family)
MNLSIRLGILGIAVFVGWACFASPAEERTSIYTPSETLARSDSAIDLDYDVVSIKPHDPNNQKHQWKNNLDGISIRGASLRTLLAVAYGVRKDVLVGGPAWVDSATFDIEVKLTDSDVHLYEQLTMDARNEMLRRVLVEKFKVRSHLESKMRPVYLLELTTPGDKSKLSKSTESQNGDNASGNLSDSGPVVRRTSGEISGQHLEMNALAQTLCDLVDRPVVDRTNLTGDYSFVVKWNPNDDSGVGRESGLLDADMPSSIFTALKEQLGLKLVAGSALVQRLVVDDAEKPSPN